MIINISFNLIPCHGAIVNTAMRWTMLLERCSDATYFRILQSLKIHSSCHFFSSSSTRQYVNFYDVFSFFSNLIKYEKKKHIKWFRFYVD